jgi:hypothetical protein
MEIMTIIECVCSVLSLIISVVSLFMVSSIKNSIRIKAKNINKDINIQQN